MTGLSLALILGGADALIAAAAAFADDNVTFTPSTQTAEYGQGWAFTVTITLPFAAPLWALIAVAVGLALLLVTAIVLLVQATRKPPGAEPNA